MRFISIEELRIKKSSALISDVSEDNNYIISELESMVIEEITAYLKGRYDTDYIFSRKGTDRSPLIKRFVIDGILCQLWERTNANEIPATLSERCEKNKEFLMNLAKGLLSADLPTLDATIQLNTYFKGSSESRFNDGTNIY